MNKQEYDNLKLGDKLKITYLLHTDMGYAKLSVGEVVEYCGKRLGCNNNVVIKKSSGETWNMSSRDLEVNKECKDKVNDTPLIENEDLVNNPKTLRY